MAAKYKEFFDLMIKNNLETFENFRKIHNEYALNPEVLQEKYNEEGGKILRIIREWEDKLCRRSEGSGYGQYAGNLAEKFQAEVRKEFPKIDCIGLMVFKINKINLKS